MDKWKNNFLHEVVLVRNLELEEQWGVCGSFHTLLWAWRKEEWEGKRVVASGTEVKKEREDNTWTRDSVRHALSTSHSQYLWRCYVCLRNCLCHRPPNAGGYAPLHACPILRNFFVTTPDACKCVISKMDCWSRPVQTFTPPSGFTVTGRPCIFPFTSWKVRAEMLKKVLFRQKETEKHVKDQLLSEVNCNVFRDSVSVMIWKVQQVQRKQMPLK